MSSTSSQKLMHRLPSPGPVVAQGPLKATIPMASLVRHCTSTHSLTKTNSHSPTLFPMQRILSADAHHSSKSKETQYNDRWQSNMRRTASLDAIYIKGNWSNSCYFSVNHCLQINKATQTEEWLGKNSEWTNGCSEIKIMRNRLQRNAKEAARASAVVADHSVALPQNNLNGRLCVESGKPPMRNSIEGLNQEIERLVLRASSTSSLSPIDSKPNYLKLTPEGHRAPLANLLTEPSSRCVNTQTPVKSELILSSNNSSGGSTPDMEAKSSPHINRFWAREPPDGCERVRVSQDERPNTLCPSKPNVMFQLKPSLGSAFYQPKDHTNRSTLTTDSATSGCLIGTIKNSPPDVPHPPEVPQVIPRV